MADVDVELRWTEGSRLDVRTAGKETALDWDHGPSPVQALVYALAACMASDVVIILEKARLPLRGLVTRATATRAASPPRRLLSVEIAFEVTGDLPPDRVERAIALSRETYCSVWHSLAKDIELRTRYAVRS